MPDVTGQSHIDEVTITVTAKLGPIELTVPGTPPQVARLLRLTTEELRAAGLIVIPEIPK